MDSRRTRVATRLPSWLWNSDPQEFGRTAGLRLTALRGQAGWWQIQTEESYRQVAPSLVELEMLAARGRVDRLGRLDDLAVALREDISQGRPIASEIDRIRRNRSGDFAAQAVVSSITVSAAAHGQIGAGARAGWQEWLSASDSQGQPMFADARVYAVRVTKALQFRASLPRILLRAESDPTLYQQLPPDAGQNVEHFRSARGLLQGLYFLDPYLAPVLVGNSPYVWAFLAPRPGVQTIFSLGRFCNGTTGEAAEALQLFGPPSTMSTPSRPTASPDDLDTALSWWVRRLNKLLAVTSDPVLYARSDQTTYSPQGHMQCSLSVEQLFRHVQSILTQVRDKHARRLAFFGFLDTFDGLTGTEVVKACTLSVAGKALARLRSDIDPVAAGVLLPPAERAVDALRAVQDGFALRVDPTNGTVELPTKHGTVERMSLEKAAALYLLVLRNATHGFGGRDDANRRRIEALLASHEGDLPDDLPLLAYLYLLQLVSDPTGLRENLRHRACP